jgi:hypothetical protein
MNDFSQLQKSFPEDMTEHKKITARMAWDSAGLDDNQSTLVREDMESGGPIMSLDNFFSRFNTALDKLCPSPPLSPATPPRRHSPRWWGDE